MDIPTTKRPVFPDTAPFGAQLDFIGEIFDLTFEGGKALPFIASLLRSGKASAPATGAPIGGEA